jgi:hypothetical protein
VPSAPQWSLRTGRLERCKTTYNRDDEDSDDAWSVPINLTVNQMLKIGKQPIQLMIGPRYWAASPEAGPEGRGCRAGITFLFPKK